MKNVHHNFLPIYNNSFGNDSMHAMCACVNERKRVSVCLCACVRACVCARACVSIYVYGCILVVARTIVYSRQKDAKANGST